MNPTSLFTVKREAGAATPEVEREVQGMEQRGDVEMVEEGDKAGTALQSSQHDDEVVIEKYVPAPASTKSSKGRIGRLDDEDEAEWWSAVYQRIRANSDQTHKPVYTEPTAKSMMHPARARSRVSREIEEAMRIREGPVHDMMVRAPPPAPLPTAPTQSIMNMTVYSEVARGDADSMRTPPAPQMRGDMTVERRASERGGGARREATHDKFTMTSPSLGAVITPHHPLFAVLCEAGIAPSTPQPTGRPRGKIGGAYRSLVPVFLNMSPTASQPAHLIAHHTVAKQMDERRNGRRVSAEGGGVRVREKTAAPPAPQPPPHAIPSPPVQRPPTTKHHTPVTDDDVDDDFLSLFDDGSSTLVQQITDVEKATVIPEAPDQFFKMAEKSPVAQPRNKTGVNENNQVTAREREEWVQKQGKRREKEQAERKRRDEERKRIDEENRRQEDRDLRRIATKQLLLAERAEKRRREAAARAVEREAERAAERAAEKEAERAAQAQAVRSKTADKPAPNKDYFEFAPTSLAPPPKKVSSEKMRSVRKSRQLGGIDWMGTKDPPVLAREDSEDAPQPPSRRQERDVDVLMVPATPATATRPLSPSTIRMAKTINPTFYQQAMEERRQAAKERRRKTVDERGREQREAVAQPGDEGVAVPSRPRLPIAQRKKKPDDMQLYLSLFRK